MRYFQYGKLLDFHDCTVLIVNNKANFKMFDSNDKNKMKTAFGTTSNFGSFSFTIIF